MDVNRHKLIFVQMKSEHHGFPVNPSFLYAAFVRDACF